MSQASHASDNGNGNADAGRRRRRIILPVAILGLVALAAVSGYFYYETSNFVSTDDANVAGHVVYVYPPVAGILETWNVHQGQYVAAQTVLGTVRAPTSASIAAQGSGLPYAPLVGVPIVTSVPGVIVQNQGVVGEQVDPALGLPLAAEVDPRDLWVQANVEETSIARVRVGQAVDVTVDALPGRRFAGRVVAIQRATQSTFSLIPASDTSGTFTKVTQRIPVKIALNSTAGLAPGMSAEVRIHLH
jgi:multidrug resistance efflux pump